MNYASLTTRIVICASVLRAHAIIPDSSLGLIEAKYSNEAQKLFIGTPSTTKLTNGTLLASFEFFSNGPDPVCMPGPIQTASMRAASAEIALQEKIEQLQLQPLRLPEDTTYVIASHDEGSTWTPDSVSQVSEMHFMTLQQLPALASGGQGPVAAIGTTSGGIRAALSQDGGLSWESSLVVNGSFSSGATPIVTYGGWVYRAVEQDVGSGGWPTHFQAVMLRGKITGGTYDSLLNPSSWECTPPVQFQYPAWVPSAWRRQPWTKPGYLEGNAVLGPDGTTIYDVLRVNSLPYANKAILMKYVPAPEEASVEHESGASARATAGKLNFDQMIDFPGGMTKFTIRRLDGIGPGGGPLYVTLSNNVTDLQCPSMRDVLTLSTSTDLIHWELHGVILHDDTGLRAEDAHRYAGFHYVDSVAEVVATEMVRGGLGGADALRRASAVDLSFVVRTAYRGAVSYHNSNRMTFKKIRLSVESEDAPPLDLDTIPAGELGIGSGGSVRVKVLHDV